MGEDLYAAFASRADCRTAYVRPAQKASVWAQDRHSLVPSSILLPAAVDFVCPALIRSCCEGDCKMLCTMFHPPVRFFPVRPGVLGFCRATESPIRPPMIAQAAWLSRLAIRSPRTSSTMYVV